MYAELAEPVVTTMSADGDAVSESENPTATATPPIVPVPDRNETVHPLQLAGMLNELDAPSAWKLLVTEPPPMLIGMPAVRI